MTAEHRLLSLFPTARLSEYSLLSQRSALSVRPRSMSLINLHKGAIVCTSFSASWDAIQPVELNKSSAKRSGCHKGRRASVYRASAIALGYSPTTKTLAAVAPRSPAFNAQAIRRSAPYEGFQDNIAGIHLFTRCTTRPVYVATCHVNTQHELDMASAACFERGGPSFKQCGQSQQF